MARYPGSIPNAGGMNAFRRNQALKLRSLAAKWAKAGGVREPAETEPKDKNRNA